MARGDGGWDLGNRVHVVPIPVSALIIRCLYLIWTHVSCTCMDSCIIHPQQRLHLEHLAASVKQELRNEAQGQLREVTTFFVQQLKTNKIAHAEVQTSADAAPSREAAVQAQAHPGRDATMQTSTDEMPGSKPPAHVSGAVRTAEAVRATMASTAYSEDFLPHEGSIVPESSGLVSEGIEGFQSGSVAESSGLEGSSSQWRGGRGRGHGRSGGGGGQHPMAGTTAGDTIFEEAEEVDSPYTNKQSGGREEDSGEDIDDEVGGSFVPHVRGHHTTSYTESFIDEDQSLLRSATAVGSARLALPLTASDRAPLHGDPMHDLMEEEHAAMMARLGEEVERLEGRLVELKQASDAKQAMLRRQSEGPEVARDAAKKAVLIGAMRLVKMKVKAGG